MIKAYLYDSLRLTMVLIYLVNIDFSFELSWIKKVYVSLICFKCELKPYTTNETNFLSNTSAFFLTPLGLILPTVVGVVQAQAVPVLLYLKTHPDLAEGSGGGGFSPFNVGGNVVKGPLSNALVFLDYDGDGIQDSDEPSVRTDSSGGYTITAAQADYTLVAVADETTIDTSSGTVLSDVVLKAPAGATVVTPTTTIMKESNLSAEKSLLFSIFLMV